MPWAMSKRMKVGFIEACMKNCRHCTAQRVAGNVNGYARVLVCCSESLDDFIEAFQHRVEEPTMKTCRLAKAGLISDLSKIQVRFEIGEREGRAPERYEYDFW